jgi:hypothetical protein
MNEFGDYWYVGSAYSNVSGFTNNNNDSIGSVDFNFGANIDKLEFINELLFTDSGVDSVTNKSGTFGLREELFSSISPVQHDINTFSNGNRIYSWSSQANYTTTLYDRDMIPFISYSQIQQSSSNYISSIDTGFRYNPFAEAWIGFSYTNIQSKSDDISSYDNMLSMYMRIFI